MTDKLYGGKDIREYPEYSIQNIFIAVFLLSIAVMICGISMVYAYWNTVLEGVGTKYIIAGLVSMCVTYILYNKWINYLWKKSRRALR